MLHCVFYIGKCLYDDALKQKLLEIQSLEERAVYILMDRINYPTQESVIVGCDNKYPLHQTNTEVGVYGVLVRYGDSAMIGILLVRSYIASYLTVYLSNYVVTY